MGSLKKETRKELLARRNSISSKKRAEASRAIAGRLLSFEAIRRSQYIALYVPFRGELDILPAARAFSANGSKILLPRVKDPENKLMDFVETKFDLTANKFDGLVLGPYSIPQPEEKKLAFPLNKIQTIIVPGVGFDVDGNRLGYGGGYYDRLLSCTEVNALVVGVAYEEQIVGSLPKSETDKQVHFVVTPKRTIWSGIKGRFSSTPNDGKVAELSHYIKMHSGIN